MNICGKPEHSLLLGWCLFKLFGAFGFHAFWIKEEKKVVQTLFTTSYGLPLMKDSKVIQSLKCTFVIN